MTTTSYRLKACNHRNKNIPSVTSIDLWSIPHLESSSTRLPMESCSWAAQPNELITNQKLADCWGRATFPRTKGANNQPLHELLEKRSYHPATNWEPETELRNSQAGVQPAVTFLLRRCVWWSNQPLRHELSSTWAKPVTEYISDGKIDTSSLVAGRDLQPSSSTAVQGGVYQLVNARVADGGWTIISIRFEETMCNEGSNRGRTLPPSVLTWWPFGQSRCAWVLSVHFP